MAKKDELNFEKDNKMASSEKLKALQAAMEKIEKSFGKGSIMKMGDDSVEQVEVIPTGSIALNVALGVGGYPRGRIIEIYGPESSGKTTLAIHAIAEAQKAGGIAAFIDAILLSVSKLSSSFFAIPYSYIINGVIDLKSVRHVLWSSLLWE